MRCSSKLFSVLAACSVLVATVSLVLFLYKLSPKSSVDSTKDPLAILFQGAESLNCTLSDPCRKCDPAWSAYLLHNCSKTEAYERLSCGEEGQIQVRRKEVKGVQQLPDKPQVVIFRACSLEGTNQGVNHGPPAPVRHDHYLGLIEFELLMLLLLGVSLPIVYWRKRKVRHL